MPAGSSPSRSVHRDDDRAARRRRKRLLSRSESGRRKSSSPRGGGGSGGRHAAAVTFLELSGGVRGPPRTAAAAELSHAWIGPWDDEMATRSLFPSRRGPSTPDFTSAARWNGGDARSLGRPELPPVSARQINWGISFTPALSRKAPDKEHPELPAQSRKRPRPTPATARNFRSRTPRTPGRVQCALPARGGQLPAPAGRAE